MKKIIPSILVILLPYLFLILSKLISKIPDVNLALIIFLVTFFVMTI